MAFLGTRVTVGTTATQITGSGDAGPRPLDSAVIKNIGAATIDLGGPGVAPGAAFPLAAGEVVSAEAVVGDDDLYGVAATGSVVVAVLRAGV